MSQPLSGDPTLTPVDTDRVAQALAFAATAHGAQLRKVSCADRPVPYLAHLMAVAALVVEFGGDTDTAVAAALHDTIEDTSVSAADLRRRFGGHVAALVVACTDTLPGDTPDAKSRWRDRKEAYLAHLRSADPAVALIALADKLHNLTSLLDAVAARGADALGAFNAPPEETRWYHHCVLDAVDGRVPPVMAARYAALVQQLDDVVSLAESSG